MRQVDDVLQEGEQVMETYDNVRIKKTGKKGTILEKGAPFGHVQYLVQLDDIETYSDIDDGLITGREDELELV